MTGCSTKKEYGLLVKGGTVFDGSGPPGFDTDIAVASDRIAAVSPRIGERKAEKVIDAREVGANLLAGLKEVEAHYPDVIVEARGRGLMIGIEIDVSHNILAGKIFAFRCLEKGIFFGYIGDKQRVIRVLPPLILSDNEAQSIIEVVSDVAGEMHTGRLPQSTVEKVNTYALGW